MKNKLICPFCRKGMNKLSEEKRVEHRIKCQIIRDNKVAPKHAQDKPMKPIPKVKG